MDLLSLPKDTVAAILRFSREQLMIWLRAVRSPLSVVSQLDLKSPESVVPAVRFAVFVYGVTWVVAAPALFVYQRVDLASPVVLLADFVATGLGFALVGVSLYLGGKLVGGRGALQESIVGGLYLTALWPIVQLTDYVLLAARRSDPPWPVVLQLTSLVAIVIFVTALIVPRAVPLLRHIHAVGTVRATIGVFVQMALVFVGLFAVLRPLFLGLAARK